MSTQLHYCHKVMKPCTDIKEKRCNAKRLVAFEALKAGFSPRKIRRTLKISHRQFKKMRAGVFAYTDNECASAAYYLAAAAHGFAK